MVKEMKKMPTEKFMNLGDYKKQAILADIVALERW